MPLFPPSLIAHSSVSSKSPYVAALIRSARGPSAGGTKRISSRSIVHPAGRPDILKPRHSVIGSALQPASIKKRRRSTMTGLLAADPLAREGGDRIDRRHAGVENVARSSAQAGRREVDLVRVG